MIPAWSAAAAARLRALVRESPLKQIEIAERSGVPIASLQRILKGTDPGARLEAIVAAIGHTTDEVLRGTASPLSAGIVEVPINDIQASAGPGRLALEEDQAVGTWPLPAEWLRELVSDVSNARVIEVSGDSQEPILRDGDRLIVDLGRTALKDGLHLLRLGEALVVKRVLVEAGSVRLLSANPSYPDIVVDLSQAEIEGFSVVGKAVGAVKTL